MCYLGNEIQQDDYGSQTATLLEKLFRATRILDLERLPEHDPTRFILAGKDRTGLATTKPNPISGNNTGLVPTYVRTRHYRGQSTRSEKERERERSERTLLPPPPPLISLFSQLRNRPLLTPSLTRDKSGASRGKLKLGEK